LLAPAARGEMDAISSIPLYPDLNDYPQQAHGDNFISAAQLGWWIWLTVAHQRHRASWFRRYRRAVAPLVGSIPISACALFQG